MADMEVASETESGWDDNILTDCLRRGQLQARGCHLLLEADCINYFIDQLNIILHGKSEFSSAIDNR